VKDLLRRSWRYLSLALGAGLLAYLVADLGPGTIVDAFARIGPRFFLMPAVALAALSVRGLSILLLLPPGGRMGAGAAIASRLAATSLNLALPVLGIGGEAARLAWVPSDHRGEGIAAIILVRSLLILAALAFLLLTVIVGLAALALPDRLRWIAVGSGLAALGAAAAIVWVTAKKGVSAPFLKVLRWAGLRSVSGLIPGALAVDSTMRSLWRERPARVLVAAAMLLASRLLLAAEIWIGLWLLEVPAGPVKALVVAAAPIGVNALFTFVPGQLGVQEAGFGLVFAVLRLGAQTGLVLGVFQRMSQLVQISLGLLCLLAAPRQGGRRQP